MSHKETKLGRLRGFYNNRLFVGKGIRWMIEDKNGRNLYCFHCGNMSNGVMKVASTLGGHFYIPLCKSHIEKIFPDAEMVPGEWELKRPHRFNKHIPNTFGTWLSNLKLVGK